MQVALAAPAEVEIGVFDVLGRHVHRSSAFYAAGSHEAEVPLRPLAAGVYVVRTRVRAASGQEQVTAHRLTVVR